MEARSSGIHHVTAVTGDAQANLDFYVGTLGLRLVKRTVNFDAPDSYHLYYGDETGAPGTALTFFVWPGAGPGRPGAGQASVVSLAIPPSSVGFWRERLAMRHVRCGGPFVRFGQEVLAFSDPGGLALEFVASEAIAAGAGWPGGPVPAEHAVRGFHGVTLALAEAEPTMAVLTDVLGLVPAGEEEGRRLLRAAAEGPGTRVEVEADPEAPPGEDGRGAVHHVAWRAGSEEAQEAWAEELRSRGIAVSDPVDRHYFRSIYFRGPGGVLFEIATEAPGFTADESVEELGSALRLPPWLEGRREEIEGRLPELRVPGGE